MTNNDGLGPARSAQSAGQEVRHVSTREVFALLERGQEIWSIDLYRRARLSCFCGPLDPPEAVLLLSHAGRACAGGALAKQRRGPLKTTARPGRPRRTGCRSPRKPPKKAASRRSRKPLAKAVSGEAGRRGTAAAAPAGRPPPPAARKPGFYEAVAIYERGVQALQRHDLRRRGRAVPDRPRAVSRGARAARTGPAVSAGLRARNRAPGAAARRRPASASTPPPSRSTPAITPAPSTTSSARSADDPDNDHAHYIMAVALEHARPQRRGASSTCARPSR